VSQSREVIIKVACGLCCALAILAAATKKIGSQNTPPGLLFASNVTFSPKSVQTVSVSVSVSVSLSVSVAGAVPFLNPF